MRSSWPAWTNPRSAWSCTEPSLQGYKACPCNWQISWLNLLKITRGCLNFVLEVRFSFKICFHERNDFLYFFKQLICSVFEYVCNDTHWRFNDFTGTQVLLELKLANVWGSKTAISAILKALKF